MIAPPEAPWTIRDATRTHMDGATAATSEARANPTVAQRNTVDVPRESMKAPVTAVATAEERRKAVITQGRSATLPSSAARSGRAAVMARPSKATIATVVKMAIEAGRS